MGTIAELGIKINSQGVEEAGKKLDSLAKSSEKVESAISGVQEPVAKLKKELSSLSAQSSTILDDKSIKSFDKTINSVRSSTNDAVKGMREFTSASNAFKESEEQAADRIKKVVAAALERKTVSLETAEAMRMSTKASQEELEGWQERVKSQNKSMQATKEFMSATKDLGKNQKELARETAKSQKEFDSLLKKIDPTQAALKKLDAQVEQLGKHFEAGKLTQAEFTKGLEKIDGEYLKLETTTSKFSSTTKATRSHVLHLLNALKSGNWKVATNNIAELGINSGLSAASLLRMAAPIGIAATAVGALGYAFVRAERENSEFNKAIYLSGNYAGTSLYKLNQYAESIRGVGGDQRKVVTALAEATKTGKFTEDQLKNVAKAALQMNAAFDIPISETINKFEQLGDSPTQSIIKLNDQYHFLTASVYDQIRALEQQGDKTGATNLAIQEFSRAQQTAAQKAIDSAGYLERSWRDVTKFINDATAALVRFGKANNNISTGERIEGIKKEIKEYQFDLEQAQRNVERFSKEGENKVNLAYWQEEAKQAQGKLEIAQDALKMRSQESSNKTESNNEKSTADEKNKKFNEEEQQYLKLVTNIDTVRERFSTSKEKMQKEVDEWKTLWEQLFADNIGKEKRDPRLNGVVMGADGLKGGEYEKGLKAIQDKYKKSAGTSKNSTSDSMLQSLKQQEALLRGQLNTTDKLGNSQQQLIKFEQKIADLKEKKILTASEKELLVNESKTKAQYTVNIALEEELKIRKEIQSQQQWINALNDKVSTRQSEVDLQTSTVWMGQKEAQEYREIINVKKEYANQRLALARNQDTENRLTQGTYEKRIQELDAAMAKEVDIVKKGQAAKRKAEENWLHGANASYQTYLEEARNVSSQTQNLFNTAFGSMEDALVSFVRTGKLSFSDFASAVLDDMARIGVRAASSSILQSVFGSALGGMFGNYAGASSDLNGFMSYSGLYAKGGAFSDGVQAFAKGGTFTNSIVSSPTPFQFAKGGVPSLGVMGEAGKEAIMPLTRTASGDLGVRAVFNQMAEAQQSTNAGNNIQVYVTVDSNGNTETTTNSTNQSGQDLGSLIDTAMQQWVVKQQRQGGLLNPKNRRNQ